MKRFAQLCMLAWLAAASAHAAIDEYEFADPEREARFHQLIDEMRCPMCLNANLSGSDAPIAADLRAEIYRQVQEGRSDEEIIDFMKARYGEFIMYRPALTLGTALLWFGPPLLLLAGFLVLRRLLKAVPDVAAEAALDTEEAARLEALLANDKDQRRS